jgi:hypothetical protein
MDAYVLEHYALTHFAARSILLSLAAPHGDS